MVDVHIEAHATCDKFIHLFWGIILQDPLDHQRHVVRGGSATRDVGFPWVYFPGPSLDSRSFNY